MDFLPCCHLYHNKCITHWLQKNTTCPECRIPIFIQNLEQLEEYNLFKKAKMIDPELRRQNIPVNDTSISIMFLRNADLFTLDEDVISDDISISKIETISNMPEPNISELYANMFSDEEDVVIPPRNTRNIIDSLSSSLSSNLSSVISAANILRPMMPLTDLVRYYPQNTIASTSTVNIRNVNSSNVNTRNVNNTSTNLSNFMRNNRIRENITSYSGRNISNDIIYEQDNEQDNNLDNEQDNNSNIPDHSISSRVEENNDQNNDQNNTQNNIQDDVPDDVDSIYMEDEIEYDDTDNVQIELVNDERNNAHATIVQSTRNTESHSQNNSNSDSDSSIQYQDISNTNNSIAADTSRYNRNTRSNTNRFNRSTNDITPNNALNNALNRRNSTNNITPNNSLNRRNGAPSSIPNTINRRSSGIFNYGVRRNNIISSNRNVRNSTISPVISPTANTTRSISRYTTLMPSFSIARPINITHTTNNSRSSNNDHANIHASRISRFNNA